MHCTCSETFGEVLPVFGRLGRIAARRHPGWAIRFLPSAVPGRRWRAQRRRPLTRAEILRGRQGAFYASNLNQLESLLSAQRVADFLAMTREGRR